MPYTVSIPDLIRDVSTRSGRAILSQLALRSPSLREYLAKQYAREPGEPGSLLADPVVEAAFAWKLSGMSMADLSNSGFLSRQLVTAMNHPDREFRDEYRFPRRTTGIQAPACMLAAPIGGEASIRTGYKWHGLGKDRMFLGPDP